MRRGAGERVAVLAETSGPSLWSFVAKPLVLGCSWVSEPSWILVDPTSLIRQMPSQSLDLS